MDDQNILGRFINDSKTIILELLDNDQLRIKTQIVNITIDDFSVKDCQTLGELLLNKAKSPIFLLAKLESIKNTFTSTMSNIKAIEDLDLLVKKYVGKKVNWKASCVCLEMFTHMKENKLENNVILLLNTLPTRLIPLKNN